MIAYDVSCENGHTFEGWFNGSASFEDQRARGLISCPYCASTRVERVPSTFAIGSRKKAESQTASASPQLAMLLQMQRFIERHFEDVGPRFADEAVKIHYGESEKKNIRGTTTHEEEQQLREEGISFFRVPIIRYDS